MTDNNQAAESAPTEGGDDVRGMRDHIKKLETEIAARDEKIGTLSAGLKLTAFEKAGLDPEKGFGKALFRQYEGEIDPNAILKFAQDEYGYEVSQPSKPEEQQRVEAVLDSGTTPTLNSDELGDQIAEAEKAGAWSQSIALKAQKLLNN